jgi:coenzyme PQQ biosynthesis protein C
MLCNKLREHRVRRQRLLGHAARLQKTGEELAAYDFVSKDTLTYFDKRMTQAPRDAEFALAYVKAHAVTPSLQAQVLGALSFKCDVLWSQLDALHHAYVDPGLPPPGAWTPGGETTA